jgi:hypothetical protein
MESMTNITAVRTPHKPVAKRRMYRGILKAPAICDCFVRATSDTAANAAIKSGKGQKAKPRFGKWELWQEAIAIDTYTASQLPAHEIPNQGLTEQELGQVYIAVQHNISVIRGMGVHTDKERQAMANAVREFYGLLTEAIRAAKAHA